MTYRKGSTRYFFRIDDDGIVTRVLNKEKFSKIDVSDNPLIRSDVNDVGTRESTETEFNAAFSQAFDRISAGKI